MSRSKSLQYYILVRLLLVPLMLLTITTVVFLLLRATPGDPVDAVLGVRAPESVKQEYRERLGLLDPLWLQYVRYLGSLLRFDLGTSITSQGEVVWDTIKQYFPATVELAVFSMATALIVGITVGAISASRPNSWLDVGGRLFGIVTYALPLFWVAPVGITGLYTVDSLLSGDLGGFFTALYYLCLPSLTLGVLLSGIFERIVRVNLKQTLRADYVEAARARGISERQILLNHALKNALIPVVTILGLTFASLLGGAVLTEVTFSWPGLANRLYEAISLRDYPTVQGILVFFATIVVLASIAIDILNAYIDPRIRY
jgi:peptide/nickel transport system permease protein